MKKKLVLILVVISIGLIVCIYNTDDEIIIFPDKNLESVIRKEIEKPFGDILKSDVKKITTLTAWEMEIKDISGIENLTSLTNLHLDDNKITNIVSLKNLTMLTKLNLNNNEVSNIEPLKKLTKLTHLVLTRNKITNIEPLKNLKKLTNLYLRHNEITDYSPVESYYDNLRYKDFDLPK